MIQSTEFEGAKARRLIRKWRENEHKKLKIKHAADGIPLQRPWAKDECTGKVLPGDVDLVVYGPGLTKMAHKVDEYIEIDEYEDTIRIFKDMAKIFLKSE